MKTSKTRIICPLCKKNNLEIMFEKHRRLSTKIPWLVCSRCGFVTTTLNLSEKALERAAIRALINYFEKGHKNLSLVDPDVLKRAKEVYIMEVL